MQHNSISEQLSQLFNQHYLNHTAKTQGFCHRLRAIQPLPLLTSLVSAMSDGSVKSIATLHRTFNDIAIDTHLAVAYKSFHNQMHKEAFSHFVRQVTCRAMALMQTYFQQTLPAKMSLFKDILIQDGSSVVLHPDLATHYPNRFTLPSPAPVKCHLTKCCGYFLMRGPKHLNPRGTQAIDVKGRNISRMEGGRLKEVLNTNGELVAIWYAVEKRHL